MTNNSPFVQKIVRHKLLLPGPVDVDNLILNEMGLQPIPHFGSEWATLYKDTIGMLKQVFLTSGDVYLLVASGSGAVESAINSVLDPGEKVLVIENGFFGERMALIARALGIDTVSLRAQWGEKIDLAAVKATLIENQNIAAILTVHHETSTGVLNPIRAISQIAKEQNCLVIVDAISSLGGEHFAMDEWGLDVCVTASNKCLASLPGLSAVAVSKKAWEKATNKQHRSGWYLNLSTWRQYWEEWAEWHPHPVTMPSNLVLALHIALQQLHSVGLKARIEQHDDVAQFFRHNLKKLGWALFVDGEVASSTITAIQRRANSEAPDLIEFLRGHGIQIAGGLGRLSGQIYRVGHMGKAATKEYASLLLGALSDYPSVIDAHLNSD